MQGNRFEWDDVKAAANARKHGVTFEQILSVFDDPYALMQFEYYENEARDLTLGLASGNVVYVVSTERGERTRIISARRATRHEQDRYYRQTLS
jgi:uncharacterized protein